MKKALSLTLGVVVCTLITAQIDASKAQGVATGPVMAAPAAAPAGVAGAAAAAPAAAGAGAAATAAAGSLGAASTIVPFSTGAGSSMGSGNSTGTGTTTGPNPTFGPGTSFGPGNSTGPAINRGAGPNSSNAGSAGNLGAGTSMAPSAANLGTVSQGAGAGNGIGTNSQAALQLRGQISNSANNGLNMMGRLAANPNFQLAQNSAGQFFIVSPNGQIQALPLGTDVNGLLGSSSSASLTSMQKAALYNPYAAPYSSTPMTLIHTTNDGNVPMAVATRSVYTNGYPTYVSGQVISEYPRTRVESFARVYPKRSKKIASAKSCSTQHKASRVYLKK